MGHGLASLAVVSLLFVCMAYYTLAERKVMASIQRRVGPNVVGPWGLLQPLADGLKLILKEFTVPGVGSAFTFLYSPCLILFLSLLGWAVLPFCAGVVLADIQLSLLLVLAVSSLGTYGIIMAG